MNEKTTEYFRSHANLIGLPLTLSNSAAYLVALGRYDEAREYAAEALQRSRGLAISHPALWAMQRLAAIAVFNDNGDGSGVRLTRAAQVLGFVDEAAKQKQLPRYGTEQQEYDKVLAALHNALGADGASHVMALGKTWTEQHAIAEALAL